MDRAVPDLDYQIDDKTLFGKNNYPEFEPF